MIPSRAPSSAPESKGYENLVQQSVPAVVAALLCWVLMAMGFVGLRWLLEQRPQFVGESTAPSRAVLVQEAPQVITRKQSDDVSVVIPAETLRSDIEMEMRGRRDHRGLRTLSDMAGTVRARYVITNQYAEPLWVLVRVPTPTLEPGEDAASFVGGLRLSAQPEGTQEQGANGWFWSGRVEAGQAATVELNYQASALRGLQYRLRGWGGQPGGQVRVSFRRQDLESTRFETGDGQIRTESAEVIWERSGYLAPDAFTARIVESRSLYDSLSQLLEMGPILGLLFLGTVMAVILGRQRMTVLQVVTLSAGYAIYFPLILYLSARFSFVVALLIAGLVPGILLVNYSRWLVGAVAGWLGGPLVLLLFQVFPTLAAFAAWNRGMVLLCLGVVTLAVLIQLQNRGMRTYAPMAAVVMAIAFGVAPRVDAASGVQVILPGELATDWLAAKPSAGGSIVFPEPVLYSVRHEDEHLAVSAVIAVVLTEKGESSQRLLAGPVHWQSWKFESDSSAEAALISTTNGIGLWARAPGSGKITLNYRVPVEHREARGWATVPLVPGVSGTVVVSSASDDLAVVGAVIWSRAGEGDQWVSRIGVAGEPALPLNWAVSGRLGEGGKGAGDRNAPGVFGIGLPRADHLTVLNSDGSCTHFAEFELPAARSEAFRVRLPADARLISLAIDGTESVAPAMEEGWCRIDLRARDSRPMARRVSLRLAFPAQHLGFMGTLELALPEVQQTAGVMSWVVALPNGYMNQVISSGLETQSGTPDLSRFGDYGQVLKTHPQVFLSKNLAPPGQVRCILRYRQRVSGVFEPTAEGDPGNLRAGASGKRREG